jgi:hypothetical protein
MLYFFRSILPDLAANPRTETAQTEHHHYLALVEKIPRVTRGDNFSRPRQRKIDGMGWAVIPAGDKRRA